MPNIVCMFATDASFGGSLGIGVAQLELTPSLASTAPASTGREYLL